MHRYSLAALLVVWPAPALLAQEELLTQDAWAASAPELTLLAGELDRLDNGDIAFSDDLQPISQPPALAAPAAEPQTRRRSARTEYVRLARVPNMLGDSLGTAGSIFLQIGMNQFLLADLPLGTGRSFKAGENNKALPMDRVFFNYQGFQNALTATQGLGPFFQQTTTSNVDRYTVGAEKTFFDGLASFEVRMPFVGAYRAANGPLAIASENVGDLSLFAKGLLYADDSVSLLAGLGVGLPTADDVRAQILNVPIVLENDAVHLLPYLAFLSYPTENWFFQGYLQGDFTASGIPVHVGPQIIGTYTEQSLLYADLLAGRWLYSGGGYLSGVAGIVELHYTTTLQDTDNLNAFGFTDGPPFMLGLGNPANRVDYLNLTAGLHFQLAQCRTCGSARSSHFARPTPSGSSTAKSTSPTTFSSDSSPLSPCGRGAGGEGNALPLTFNLP